MNNTNAHSTWAKQLKWIRQRPAEPTEQSFDIRPNQDLDYSQQEASQHGSGPIRVLAPAGSGKTRTLLHRLEFLLANDIPKEDILVLCFNKNAVTEMQERATLMKLPKLEIQTLHSYGYGIIRKILGWTYQPNDALYRQLVIQALTENEIKLEFKREENPLDIWLETIQSIKEDLPDIAKIKVPFEEESISIEPIWNTLLKLQNQHRMVRFEDMVYLAVRLFWKNPEQLHQEQDRRKWILVDEYQDLNRSQHLLLQMILWPQNNFFAVGDDDQLIYGWRGADLSLIHDFDTHFPGSQTVLLSTNYRCCPEITTLGSRLIQNNNKRVPKDIRSSLTDALGNRKLFCAVDIEQEVETMLSWLQNHQEQTAILTRYYEHLFVISENLTQLGIAHNPPDYRRLLHNPFIKDVLCYWTALFTPDKMEAWQWHRILKRPNKYFSKSIVQSISSFEDLQRATKSASIKSWIKRKLSDFADDLRYLQSVCLKKNSGQALMLLLQHFPLEEEENPYQERDVAENQSLVEVLFAIMENHPDPFEFLHWVSTLENPPPHTPQDGEWFLSTIHQSKGQEWEQVAVFHLQEQEDLSQLELEEERRLVYVSITRARKHLWLSTTQKQKSPFFDELKA